MWHQHPQCWAEFDWNAISEKLNLNVECKPTCKCSCTCVVGYFDQRTNMACYLPLPFCVIKCRLSVGRSAGCSYLQWCTATECFAFCCLYHYFCDAFHASIHIKILRWVSKFKWVSQVLSSNEKFWISGNNFELPTEINTSWFYEFKFILETH